jgi:isoleucyl-tRNA synthetase
MCLICIDLKRNKLTSREARRNLEETHELLDEDHIMEILRAIWKQEDAEQEADPFDLWFNSGAD